MKTSEKGTECPINIKKRYYHIYGGTHATMSGNHTAHLHSEFIRDTDKLYHKILNWNSSFNGTYEGRRYNISHFIEFQASVIIWRYVAPVILVVGTIGSILSLLVLCRKSLRSQTTMFYLSALAVADLMVLYAGLVRLWLEHAENIYIRLMSRAACKAHNFFVYVALDLSVWILVAVSVDRCLYVSWPQWAKKWCKLRNARITVVAIAVFSALINVHFFWTYDLEMADSQHIYANGNKKCYADTSSELAVSFVENVWPWIDFCVYCLFPFMFMATSNSMIIKQLVRTERNMASYSNFNLDVGQRSAQELRRASQFRLSTFTSPGRNSNAGPEEETKKDGEGNHFMNSTRQLGMSERIIKSCGDPSTVQVVSSSEMDTQRALSMDVLLRSGRKSKFTTPDNSVKCTENSGAVFDFDACVTPNVTTIMSGNCQSILASNKQQAMKRGVHVRGIRMLESHGVETTDFFKGNTILEDKEDKSEPYLSMINTTSTQGSLTSSRLNLESQLDSEKLHATHSKFETPPIQLAVFDELTDAAVQTNLTAIFQQDHIERKNSLSGIHTNMNDIRPPKPTERRKTLSNRVHPLQQINHAYFPDIFSVSIPDTPGASEEITAFWTLKNDGDELLMKDTNIDSITMKHMIYDVSLAENITNADCTSLNNNTNQVLKPNSDHLENNDIGVNKSHCNNEMVGTDTESKPHYHNFNTDMDVDKSHCHNDNSGMYVNKSHCTDIDCTDTYNTSHCQSENIDAVIQNIPHYDNPNTDFDVNKSHYHNDTIGVAIDKSQHHNENNGISVNKSHYLNENICSTDVNNKLHCRTANSGVERNQSHHHNENNGVSVNQSHHPNENNGVSVNQSHHHNENNGISVNQSHHPNENNGISVNQSHHPNDNNGVSVNQSHHPNDNNAISGNKSHYHNENIGTDVNNQLHCRIANIGVDTNQSHHHNDNNGISVNKSHYHNENIGTDRKNKLYCCSDTTEVDLNQSPNHKNNNGIDVNRSHYRNEDIDTDMDNKLHCRIANIGVDVNQSHHHNDIDVNKSHYHNEDIDTDMDNKLHCRTANVEVDKNHSHHRSENNGIDVNKSHYHSENIGTDIDIKPPRHGSLRGVHQTLGLPQKSLSSSQNKWQNSSIASDTQTSGLSRRNTSSVSKTLLAVTIVFWVLNAPIVIFIIGQTYIITSADDRGRAVVILAWTVVNILQYMNAALHFFLYCLSGPKFRQEFKDMLKEWLAMAKRIVS